MRKAILIIIVGLILGYWWGFHDSRAYGADIVTRMVERAGGSNRQLLKTDVDSRMEQLER